jgi:hypothetical protein
MNLGQTMLMILFFGILIVMFTNAFRTLNDADVQVLTAEAYKTAADLGQSLMSEILTKKFDQNSTPTALQTDYTVFTSPSSLGPDGAGEQITLPDRYPYKSISTYNDVDDYKGYTRLTDSTSGLNGFKDSVIVYYVQMTNPPTVYSGKWWTKRIEVWVTNTQYLYDSKNNVYKWLKFYSIATNIRKG